MTQLRAPIIGVIAALVCGTTALADSTDEVAGISLSYPDSFLVQRGPTFPMAPETLMITKDSGSKVTLQVGSSGSLSPEKLQAIAINGFTNAVLRKKVRGDLSTRPIQRSVLGRMRSGVQFSEKFETTTIYSEFFTFEAGQRYVQLLCQWEAEEQSDLPSDLHGIIQSMKEAAPNNAIEPTMVRDTDAAGESKGSATRSE